MNKKFFVLSCLLTAFLGVSSIAQSLSGIVNSYARVTTYDTCDMRFRITDTTGFRRNMRVLLLQINGAATNGGNSSAFGAVDALNSVGKYEINFIDSVSGPDVFLRFYLKNTYDADAILQIVTYPSYANAVVTDTLRAKPWNGESGGVIAFEATNLTLNAPIDASAAGFRGGGIKQFNNCDALENYNDYYYAQTATGKSNGGLKGEGISAIVAGKECGRGAQANGGGGGNNHKSGGGGGGHVVAGGIGGEQKHVNDFRNCGGRNPGFDGKAIAGLGNDRFIFGGGGGSGHNREGTDSRGGNGGGLILIKTNTLTSNGKKIVSNGSNGGSNGGDGGGGGGAGGTIVLLSSQNSGAVKLEARGGNGGNTGSLTEYDFGPGGGGAGGRIIRLTTSGVSDSLAGGIFGKNDVQRSGQGAEKGKDGVAVIVPSFSLVASVDTISRVLMFTQHPQKKVICEYATTTLTVQARGARMTYEWQVHRGDDRGFVPIVSDSVFIGVNTPILILNRVRTNLNPYLFRCVIRSECASIREVIKSDSVGLTIIPAPIGAFTPNINFNTVSFTNGSSNAVSYLWNFGNGQTSTATSPTFTYAAQGTYTVILKSINSCFTDIDTFILRLNALPKANFTANTNDYCTPASVRFTNTSANNMVSAQWIFAGGSPSVSTDLNPSVIYTAAGIYDVVLIAINANGRDTIRRTSYIRVSAAPIANFIMSRATNSTTVSFINRTAGASTYSWTFGDGTTSTDPAPQHVYRSTGVFVVCLTATNACGTTTQCDTLTFLSQPSAQVTVNQTIGCLPHTAQFSGQNPTNVTSWLWTFQGGNPATSTSPNPRIVYATAGVYGVTLRVSNASGINTTTLDSFITVKPKPVAKFAIVSVDSTIATFQNLSSDATYYRWAFGDGTGSDETNPPPHTYYRNGNYPVTLQALNSVCGAVTTQTVAIFVVGTSDTEGGRLTIFPNPTDGNVTLDFKNALPSATQMRVTNARGQVVKTAYLSTEQVQTFDFNDLSRGVYFLQFTSERGRFIRKLVKM